MLISWNVTKRCNLYCAHCYRDSGPHASVERQLTTGEGLRLIDEIAEAGFKMIIFSGGEPLLREDLPELVAHAKTRGMRAAMGSNGTLLTAEKARELKVAGLAGAAISLDSASPEHHDRFRGDSGSWEKAVDGIRHALDADLKVQINMTITEHNAGDFAAMTDLAVELGVQALHPFFLVPTGRGKSIEEDALKKGRYYQTLRQILSRQKNSPIEIKPTCAPQFMPLSRDMELNLRFSRGCLAGVSYCCVLPDGEVNICPYLPVSAGNVRERPFHEIWRESNLFQDLRDYTKYEGTCGACGDVGICGGCRARSYYYSGGNLLAEEPWCYKRENKDEERICQ
ncbi:radical SAM protein [Gorillibacterium massiliense]|uniref:radical SAM protein n=1 Tax=Gorillibacterium massiliense TaxID=1280390 RepID=UPI0004BAFFA0|nr:radical SAM protein [Gorillibacterium massiliense]